MFKSSIDYRNAASAINSFKDYFPSGVYKPTEVETIHLGVDGLSAEALEELLSTSNMSIDDIMELIALQHAPAGSLPPAGQARLEELQQQLLNSNPAAWGLYVTYQGPQNDTIKEFMQLLRQNGYVDKFVYTSNMTSRESLVEQIAVFEALLAADPTGEYSNFYRKQIENLKNSLINRDMSEAATILSKDIDDITEEEWYTLAEIAYSIPPEELENLLEDFYDVQINAEGDVEFGIDRDKYAILCQYMSITYAGDYPNGIEEITGDISERHNGYNEYQRLVLFLTLPVDQINNMGYELYNTDRGKYDSDEEFLEMLRNSDEYNNYYPTIHIYQDDTEGYNGPYTVVYNRCSGDSILENETVKDYDKRESIKERDIKREVQKNLKNY